ncbi:MAG TPA: hypothetical protein VFZ68_18465 [Acidimicrobiales bacterium]
MLITRSFVRVVPSAGTTILLDNARCIGVARLPPAVEDAWRLAGAGVDRDAAAAELAARHGTDRGQLEEAVLDWYRRMHRLPSDDFQATRVLRVLEAALRRVPRTPTPAP